MPSEPVAPVATVVAIPIGPDDGTFIAVQNPGEIVTATVLEPPPSPTPG